MNMRCVLSMTLCILCSDLARADSPAVELGDMKSQAPADWKLQKTTSNMRLYQFTVDKAEGDPRDADIIIFNFGRNGGGSADANVKRWKGMFIPPQGKAIDDVAKVEEFKVGPADVTYVDIEGTYKFKEQPMDTKEELRPNSRMIAAMFQSPKGQYYIRFIGPAKTVSAHKQEFDNWLKAFK